MTTIKIKQDKTTPPEQPNNLEMHRQMYERRLRLMKERGGLNERDAADQANDPSLFDTEESRAAEE